MTYLVGNVARISASVTDSAGNLVSPTTVVLKVKLPDASVVTPSVTKLSDGKYYADVPLEQSGKYLYRFESAGTATAAVEGYINVDSSKVL